ncbi:hypothetical protein AVEN_177232-1 [Araneus ventricosus]|uniref:Uncharacterized protein n=1 Tax=Araneus ventricosus TaxID=182803 RepID=A0A4Y2KVI3_ARAVE|nr:hypothetical protein AVEN_177232-1 [Araneus ventricosus]
MEKQLKYVLMLSLKEMALRRVAVLLWYDSDILTSISKFQSDTLFCINRRKEWRETIDKKIKDKMLKLNLPESLTKQMIDIVEPISLEIKRWKTFHGDFIYNSYKEISSPDLAKLCWTTVGTINYQKTAEEFVRCNALNVEGRYKLACLYCLEDYIPFLWEELPKYMKEHFYNEYVTLPYLPYFWPHILKRELSKLDYLLRTSGRNLFTLNQYAFEYSAEKGNKTAAEYFFQKLTQEEREASLMRTTLAVLANPNMELNKYVADFPKEKFSDVFCYLLSLMTPEQQLEILQARPVDVFLCFLDWPWQDLFLENADLIWTLLHPSGYGDLILKMMYRYSTSDFYFPKLFQDFFMQSPLDFKKKFIDPEHAYPLLCKFFDSEDSETIQVIFRNVDAVDRVKLVCHCDVLELFYFCMVKDGWHMVEVCLREATLCKEDGKRLKEVFMEFLKCKVRGEIMWRNGKFKRFSEFLDETDVSADKGKKA